MADAQDGKGGTDPGDLIGIDDRSLVIAGPINEAMAYKVVAALYGMSRQNSSRPIKLFINSPGGEVGAGMLIYDAMQHVKAPVWTVVTGSAYSMAALLFLGGEAGRRYMYRDAKLMYHLPSAPQIPGGNRYEIQETLKELERAELTLYRVIRESMPADRAEALIAGIQAGQNFWIDSEQAERVQLATVLHSGKRPELPLTAERAATAAPAQRTRRAPQSPADPIAPRTVPVTPQVPLQNRAPSGAQAGVSLLERTRATVGRGLIRSDGTGPRLAGLGHRTARPAGEVRRDTTRPLGAGSHRGGLTGRIGRPPVAL